MKRSLARSGFSLIEVTLALGVAGFCLIAIMGLLPVGLKTNQAAIQQTTANGILSAVVSDIRSVGKGAIGPGNSSKQFKVIFGNPRNPNVQTQFLYFSNAGSTNSGDMKPDHADGETVFWVLIEYMPDPTGTGARTATLLHVKVAWPYAGIQPPTNGPTPAGFVETFQALDRDRL
jgi:type II secretory pathway pseudopilin PulG